MFLFSQLNPAPKFRCLSLRLCLTPREWYRCLKHSFPSILGTQGYPWHLQRYNRCATGFIDLSSVGVAAGEIPSMSHGEKGQCYAPGYCHDGFQPGWVRCASSPCPRQSQGGWSPVKVCQCRLYRCARVCVQVFYLGHLLHFKGNILLLLGGQRCFIPFKD